MKRTILVLMAILVAAGSARAARRVAPEALGTVRYEVRYKWGGVNTKVADATISLERASWEKQDAYHSHVAIQASSIFRLFMSSDYLVDIYLSQATLDPLYFVNPVKKGGKYEYFYDKKAGVIRSEALLPPADPVSTTFPMDGRTMDLAMLLQYVRFVTLAEGASQKLHVLMSGKSFAATLIHEGTDSDRYPGRTADRFLVRMTERGLMENGSGKEITVWRSTGSDRHILGLETTLSGSSSMSVAIVE